MPGVSSARRNLEAAVLVRNRAYSMDISHDIASELAN